MSYAIQNSDGEHLGFLLMAGEAESGDCIFRSLPADAENLETPSVELLFQLQQQGEFSWAMAGEKIRISSSSSEVAVIQGSKLTIGDVEFSVVALGGDCA